MILGAYYTAISAISAMEFSIIMVIGSGILVGVLVTSKIVRFLLQRFNLLMYALMMGLVAGSTIVLYPGFSSEIIPALICLIALVSGFLMAYFSGRIR